MYGKFLKQFSMDTGVQQKEVAAKLKYSPQRVNNYFRDMAEPPFEFLENFKKEFNVDLRRLADKEHKTLAAGVASFNPIPVFDLDAKPFDGLDFFNHSELILNYIDVPLYNDCFAAVAVQGQSMSPDYNAADLVAIKRIEDLEIIPYGEAFLIITNEQRLLRYIQRNDKAPEKSVILRAENPHFDDIIISKAKIKYLFQVKGRLIKF